MKRDIEPVSQKASQKALSSQPIMPNWERNILTTQNGFGSDKKCIKK